MCHLWALHVVIKRQFFYILSSKAGSGINILYLLTGPIQFRVYADGGPRDQVLSHTLCYSQFNHLSCELQLNYAGMQNVNKSEKKHYRTAAFRHSERVGAKQPHQNTLCLKKNHTDVAYYNFNAHLPIFTIFGRDVAERVC